MAHSIDFILFVIFWSELNWRQPYLISMSQVIKGFMILGVSVRVCVCMCVFIENNRVRFFKWVLCMVFCDMLKSELFWSSMQTCENLLLDKSNLVTCIFY